MKAAKPDLEAELARVTRERDLLAAWVFGTFIRDAPEAKWRPYLREAPVQSLREILARYQITVDERGESFRVDACPIPGSLGR